jgi:hypothetical protein
MPPLQPSLKSREKVIRQHEAKSLSEVAQKASVKAAIKHNRDLSQRAVRLYRGIKAAGLLKEWFAGPANPDYPDQSVAYNLAKDGRNYSKKSGKLIPKVALRAQVSMSLADGKEVQAVEGLATFNRKTAHIIGDTERTADSGISAAYSADYVDFYGSPSLPTDRGVILVPFLGDLSDTLDLIEAQAVARGMEPVSLPPQPAV